MALDTSAELDAAIQEAGVPVSSIASSTYGILNVAGALEQTDGAGVQRIATTLTVRTGTIADLGDELPLTVDGECYVVRWFEPRDDGALTAIVIAKVTP